MQTCKIRLYEGIVEWESAILNIHIYFSFRAVIHYAHCGLQLYNSLLAEDLTFQNYAFIQKNIFCSNSILSSC